MKQPTELSAALARAANHIEQYGHNQGAFFAPSFDSFGRPRYASTPHQFRPTCMAGAINTACTGQPDESNELAAAAIRFASTHLGGEVPADGETGEPDYVEHLADWNDARDRTREDVVVRLRMLSLLVDLPVLREAVAA